VHEPDIAPLARRLAEENNVDWRRLSGTGEDGRVVERDVLGYLARVMAGEEAIDPTPEPVPEGMEAWPADDVGRYAASEGDDDPTSPPTLDDDLFLFEDPAPPASGEESDALFVASDDDRGPGEAFAAEAAAPPEEDGHVLETPGGGEGESEAESESEGESETEEGVWLVGDDAVEDDAASADAAEPPATEFGEPVDLGGADDGSEMRLDELPDLTGGDDDAGGHAGAEEGARLAGGREALELPDLFSEEGGAHDDAAAAYDGFSLDVDAGPELDDDGVDATPSPASMVASSPAPAVAAEPAPAVGERDGAGPSAVPATDQPALAVALVRHGQLWRRRIDDRTLRQVASDAAAALDVAPTTVVVLLMARAAHRAGVADGSVETWRWGREGADRLAVDPEAPVRDAARRIEAREANADAAAVGLVVADLGGLDVDEAVLHLETPVLALGRSSADGAWLSLSGDDLDGAAASGLARIAEFLASPVRLLL
jgi:hypothetical protein